MPTELDKHLEQVGVYDERFEQSVIGAMLISPQAIEVAIEILKPVDFYLPRYQKAFKAITRMYSEGREVDELTLVAEMKLEGSEKDDIGRSIVNTPSAAGIEEYCERVRSLSLSRAMMEMAGKVARGVSGGQKAEEILAFVSKESDRIQARLAGREQEPVSLQSIAEQISASADGPALSISGLRCGVGQGCIDAVCDGWEMPSHTILAARASAGKSTMALAILRGIQKNNPKHGRPIVFTTENSPTLTGMASLATELGVSVLDIKRRNLTSQDLAKMRLLIQKKALEGVDVVEANGWTVAQIRACARRHQRKYGLSAILIDMGKHLKSGMEDKGATAHCAEISGSLYRLTKELGCATIVTVQINRESLNNDQKKPDLANLKDSGSWEEDADRVVILHRPSYFGDGDKRTEFMLKKDRLAGQAGRSCFLMYHPETGNFSDATETK